MRILVCGSRDWNNELLVLQTLELLPQSSVIIHGNCEGADLIAASIATKLGLQVLAFPADWKKYGRAAGPKRNQQMLDEGKPSRIIAFHNNLESSKGTKDMVSKAKKLNLPVEIISEKK